MGRCASGGNSSSISGIFRCGIWGTGLILLGFGLCFGMGGASFSFGFGLSGGYLSFGRGTNFLSVGGG